MSQNEDIERSHELFRAEFSAISFYTKSTKSTTEKEKLTDFFILAVMLMLFNVYFCMIVFQGRLKLDRE
jgi:hypothetical protein